MLPARSPLAADVLVLEHLWRPASHEDRTARREQLQQMVEALGSGGAVIVPAFGIGHTRGCSTGSGTFCTGSDASGPHAGPLGPRALIYLDSPLAGAPRLYRELQPYWDEEALARVRGRAQAAAFDQAGGRG